MLGQLQYFGIVGRQLVFGLAQDTHGLDLQLVDAVFGQFADGMLPRTGPLGQAHQAQNFLVLDAQDFVIGSRPSERRFLFPEGQGNHDVEQPANRRLAFFFDHRLADFILLAGLDFFDERLLVGQFRQERTRQRIHRLDAALM